MAGPVPSRLISTFAFASFSPVAFDLLFSLVSQARGVSERTVKISTRIQAVGFMMGSSFPSSYVQQTAVANMQSDWRVTQLYHAARREAGRVASQRCQW